MSVAAPRKYSRPSNPLPLPESWNHQGIAGCLVAVAPLIEEARTRVRNGARRLAVGWPEAPFAPESIDEILASPLAQQILLMMMRVLALEVNVARLEGLLAGSTPQERFESFINRFRVPANARRLLREYPVLAEQITKRLDTWSRFGLEFLQHLCEDWTELKHALLGGDPGLIVKINGGAGDTHREGRSVMTASFADGSALVYKPRALAVDKNFQRLLLWLNDRGATPQFQPMKIVNRAHHGWCEFIQSEGCSSEAELARFYERQGSYLAILYALDASDFHYENLIAKGEHPFLVDMEALFHQRVETSVPGAQNIVVAALGSSVFRTGLLPVRFGMTDDYAGIDLSGLSNPAGQLTPVAMPQIDRVNTDEMHVVRKRAPMIAGGNCPTLDGREASAFQYADSVMAGFESMYHLILKNRVGFDAEIERFANDEVRFIPRPSQTYGNFLSESFHPDLLRDRAERAMFFKRLGESTRDQPVLSRLSEAEHRDLLRGDVPLFVTCPGSRDVLTGDGECLPGLFEEPAIATVRRRVAGLSEADLDWQLWIIRGSLATLSHSQDAIPRTTPVQHRASVHSGDLLANACAIGDRLTELAITRDGAANWAGLAGAGDGNRYVSPLGIDLYDGLPGVVHFLVYLAKISGHQRYEHLARSGMKTLLTQIDDYAGWGGIGAFAGWAGVVYALVHAATAWSDSSLLAQAERLLERISPLVSSDTDLDMIAGAAGCALAVTSLATSGKAIEVARACGERLTQSAIQTEAGVGWLCAGATGSPLTGFAHGNAGIAYALLTIAELTGDSRFRGLASAAIEYERALFSPKHGNWPDLRAAPAAKYASAWCHGGPGIGLARLLSLRYLDDPMLRQEISAALAVTVSDGFHESHTLCHGDLGRVDILLRASEVLDEPCWRMLAQQRAERVIEHARASGWICGQPLQLETPGLMTGLAGIGYAMLRLLNPERVPCVLSLDSPRVSV